MSMRFRARLAAAAMLCLLLPASAGGQQQALTLDDIYHPDKKVDFEGSPPTGLVWIDDTHYLWAKRGAGEEAQLLKVEALTGRTEPLFDVARVEKTLATLDGVSPDGARVAFVRDNDLFVVEVSGGAERPLTTDGSANVLNGKLDWLYQEEIYGRGKFRAHW